MISAILAARRIRRLFSILEKVKWPDYQQRFFSADSFTELELTFPRVVLLFRYS
jgi:hypothetical protein